ncbi:EexN family lipoprotein [Neorhizobium sp. DT-125]|uniref:EexN family lipoprotein n=1 Tax=Neorhizobium sp. DT-125 TaxID=3396163 RepID=UPI003F199674
MIRVIAVIVGIAVGGAATWNVYSYFSPGPEVITVPMVDEYLAGEKPIADQLAKCRNDPGARCNSPSCVNAEAADARARLKRMNEALGG